MAASRGSKASKVAKKSPRKKAAKSASGVKKRSAKKKLVVEGKLAEKEVAVLKERHTVILAAEGPITITAASRGSKASKVAKKRPRKNAAKSASGVKKRSAKKKVSGNEEQKLVLEGKLVIKDVAQLKERLTVILAAKGPITIDAARVESADTAALQLLSAFVSTSSRQSRVPKWKPSSSALLEVSRLLDLDKHLGLDAELNGDEVNEANADLCPVF